MLLSASQMKKLDQGRTKERETRGDSDLERYTTKITYQLEISLNPDDLWIIVCIMYINSVFSARIDVGHSHTKRLNKSLDLRRVTAVRGRTASAL
mmetsp:Transcript_10930/g.36905  ORF Transcript_10930/g.36905 Transcript_10930/m.36905 type:complete len:95 (-) Transcript_10930:234-518(-)